VFVKRIVDVIYYYDNFLSFTTILCMGKRKMRQTRGAFRSLKGLGILPVRPTSPGPSKRTTGQDEGKEIVWNMQPKETTGQVSHSGLCLTKY
jgi:hypothetical protein